jgi:site-specific DNA-cytosine methylase
MLNKYQHTSMQTNNQGITAVGLFDGLAGLYVSLTNLGIPVQTYLSSEIAKPPKLVARKNFPNIIDIGDITKVRGYDFPRANIMGIGSPCQDLSQANTSGQGLDGEKSILFDEAIRWVRENRPYNILFENVVPKDRYWIYVMTQKINEVCREVGIINGNTWIEPVIINSSDFGAQNRPRIYWTNIPINVIPKNQGLILGSYLYDNHYKEFTLKDELAKTKYIKKKGMGVQWNPRGHNSQGDRAYFLDQKIGTLTKSGSKGINICVDYDKNIFRKLHPIEAERLQGLPDNYTLCDGVSENQRFGMIGNGWDIKVIEFLLSNLKNKLGYV